MAITATSLTLALAPQGGPPPPPPPPLVGNAYVTATLVYPAGTVPNPQAPQATLKKFVAGNPNGIVFKAAQNMVQDAFNPALWTYTFAITGADNVAAGDIFWAVITANWQVQDSDIDLSAPAKA